MADKVSDGPSVSEIVRNIWQAHGPPQSLPALSIRRDAEILPSIYRVGTAAIVSVALTGLAYDALARTLGGSAQTISVDGREASLAFRSEVYLRINGKAPRMWAELSGDYRAIDGWIRLHANYPHHARAIAKALGVAEEREAVEAAVASRGAVDVETLVLAKGGAAAALRNRASWHASDPGKAVLAAPLVEITQIGDAAPRPPHEIPRILDLTRVISGPLACKILASLRMDVIRVGSRTFPEIEAAALEGGFGKRLTYVDIKDYAGRETFAALVRGADAIVQTLRPGALDALGFGAEAAAELRPGIVFTSITAYGRRGPWSKRRGFDSLVQLATGLADNARTSYGREAPVPLPAQALDHATGWLAAFGTLVALEKRAREGGSWRVDLSLARTAEWLASLGNSYARDAVMPKLEDDPELVQEVRSPFGTLSHLVSPLVVDGVRVSTASPPPIAGVPLWR